MSYGNIFRKRSLFFIECSFFTGACLYTILFYAYQCIAVNGGTNTRVFAPFSYIYTPNKTIFIKSCDCLHRNAEIAAFVQVFLFNFFEFFPGSVDLTNCNRNCLMQRNKCHCCAKI